MSVLNEAIEHIKKDLIAKYPNVSDELIGEILLEFLNIGAVTATTFDPFELDKLEKENYEKRNEILQKVAGIDGTLQSVREWAKHLDVDNPMDTIRGLDESKRAIGRLAKLAGRPINESDAEMMVTIVSSVMQTSKQMRDVLKGDYEDLQTGPLLEDIAHFLSTPDSSPGEYLGEAIAQVRAVENINASNDVVEVVKELKQLTPEGLPPRTDAEYQNIAFCVLAARQSVGSLPPESGGSLMDIIMDVITEYLGSDLVVATEDLIGKAMLKAQAAVNSSDIKKSQVV